MEITNGKGLVPTLTRRTSRIGQLLGPLSLALVLAAFNIGCAGVTSSKSTNTATGALQINTPALPNAITQTAYSGVLSATGGTTPYTWGITYGSLPPGLNLSSSSGAITGTPTTAGTFTFTAQAKDSSPAPQTATASASVLTVELLQITTTSLPDPQVQTSYSATLTASGGMLPYVWSISSGNLPLGLSLDGSSGVISGVPTSTGSYAFTVEVSDPPSFPQKSKKLLNATVQPKTLQITTSGLPGGQVQVAYSAALAASGGTTPYSWSISSGGSLPAGLALNLSTGAISGTPTQSGTFSFTVQVADSVSLTAQQALNIIVSAAVAPSITTQPASQTVTAGQTATVSVAATGTAPLSYQWQKNGAAISGATSASYTTPATSNSDNGAQFTVIISNSAASDTSNSATLTVTTVPSITSLSPTSGPVGTSVTITGANFGSTQGTSSVTFNGTKAIPTSWSATSIVAPVPSGAATGNVLVTVAGLASNAVSFTLTTPPSITSLSPTSGPVGTSVTITGTNFGSTQGASSVTFNGTKATPTSWSATSIVAPVPSGATTGNVLVTVAGLASNVVSFTLITVPSITSLSPTSGPVGTSVTITGTNFGST